MNKQDLERQLVEWRHALHQCPEPPMEERETAAYVAEELKRMGLDVQTGIGGTGLVASLKAGNGTDVIGLRADMDALGFEELTELPYKSRKSGWTHACGHDGHMAMLLGAAKILSEDQDFDGTVRFVFQPAEEPGLGAKAMIADGLLEQFPMDEIYGIHNAPQLPAGSFHTRAGGLKASEDDFVVKIYGKGSHASYPHMSKDPIVIAAQIVLAFQTIVSRSVDPLDPVVVSCTDIRTDGIRNSIPSHAEITGDVRCFKAENQDLVEGRMRKIAQSICSMYDAECEVIYSREFIPTVNDAGCVETAVAAAERVAGKEKVNGNCEPDATSEDLQCMQPESRDAICFWEAGERSGRRKRWRCTILTMILTMMCCWQEQNIWQRLSKSV